MTLFRYQLVKVNGSFQRALGVQVGVDAVKVREFPLSLQKENEMHFSSSLFSLCLLYLNLSVAFIFWYI